MSELSDYEVTFSRSPIGFWVWRAKGPDGEVFGPALGGASVGKAAAEASALAEIHRRLSRETVNAAELERRRLAPASDPATT